MVSLLFELLIRIFSQVWGLNNFDSYSNFSDFDFEGSNFSVLIDLYEENRVG
mgnify:CR=1 FL=1